MLHFDAHVHIGNIDSSKLPKSDLLGYKSYTKNTASSYIRKALSCGVSKAIIFPFVFPEFSFEKQNDYVLSQAKRYPYFFLPFLLPESLTSLSARNDRFYGIKDHFYFDKLEDRNLVLDYAQSNKKIYLIHSHFKRWKDSISNICNNFPSLKVIIAHSARPTPFSAVGMREQLTEILNLIPNKLRNNFYFDTSTIRDPSGIEFLVSKVGADHVIWGTDSPYFNNEGENVIKEEIDTINNTKISDSDKKLIFEDNFRFLLQENKTWTRISTTHDASILQSMLYTIPKEEQKFLALQLKMDLLKQLIRKGKHIIIAESSKGEIQGFLRWSDRHNNTVMIEEVYVLPKYRLNKIATLLISNILPTYNRAQVKTFANNDGINHLLKKMLFKPTFSKKRTMISWTL